MPRPSRDEYYMVIAMAVRKRASCTGNRVGAILVRDDRIISTGYNGTAAGTPNCEEGGCERCANRHKYRSGEGYDLCVCIHAEANTILTAARFGIATAGSVLYTTMRPCFSCAKEALQAKIVAIRYLHEWHHPDPRLRENYDKLLGYFPGGVQPVVVPDPDEAWAITSKRSSSSDPQLEKSTG